MENKFRESFEKSPIGILFFDKEGNLTDANKSALEVGGVPSLNGVLGLNIFNELNIDSKKDELLQKGLIKFEYSVNFDNVKKLGIYNPKRSGSALIDLTISIIASGFLVQIQDITEIKQIERELLESEENFRVIADESPISITVYRDKRHLYANPAAESFLGYKKEELFKMDFMDFIHPDYRKMIKKSAQKRMHGDQKLKRHELKIITKDGTEKWAETYSSIINYKGAPAVIVTSIDITERKKAEEELKHTRDNLGNVVNERTKELEKAYESLKDSEERYKQFFEASPNFTVHIGLNGKIIDANNAAVEILSKSKEELIGKNFTEIDMIIKEDIPIHVKNFLKLLMGKHVDHYETRIKRDGEIRWGDTYPIILRKHKLPNSVLVISHDITDRKRAEEELQKSRESFRTLAENSPDLIFRVNKDFKCIYINPIITEYTNRPYNSFIGKKIDEFGFPEKYTSSFKEDYKKIFETGEKQNIEYKLPTTQENRFFYAINVPEYNSKGEIQTALSVVRDITDRKQAEEQLKEIIEELERSNYELQQFAYITSHDLQEPLRTIVSYAQLLKTRYEGQLDGDADDFLDFMVAGSTRMKDQIKGLLDYSRVGTHGEEFKEFNAEESLNIALANLQSRIQEYNAKINSDKLPLISADKNQISLVFQNLIENALKFRKEGLEPKIYISAQKTDNEHIFGIHDNGIGMEEQYTDKIFEIFKRLHAIGEYHGSGIGLAIVKRIIDRHGGRVWVESELGRGYVFYFTIPITVKK